MIITNTIQLLSIIAQIHVRENDGVILYLRRHIQ